LRYFYDVNDLLFSFAVFAVIPLLLAAVFRCYFAAAGFKKPEFLRPSEVLPLYFPVIISGISERGHWRSNSARYVLRSAADARIRCTRGVPASRRSPFPPGRSSAC
jgi:hypothetical protein